MPSPRLAETILDSWQSSVTTKRAPAIVNHQLHRFGIEIHSVFRWFQLAHQVQQSFGVICAEWWQRDCHQFRYRGPEPGHQPRSELPRPASRTADTSAKVAAESS